MQHHVHAARAAPHLRAVHHHSHMAMQPPPQHPGLEQHLSALTATATQQQQQQQAPPPQRVNHQHQYHNNSNNNTSGNNNHNNNHNNNNHNNSSSNNIHNNSNQMQKIRQQHQHLSNGHLSKCNPSAATVAAAAAAAVVAVQQHQQQQQQQQQQPPPPPPPTAATAQGFAHPAALGYGHLPPHMAHLGSYAAQPPPAMLGGSNPTHFYLSSAKPSKYGNNANVSSSNTSISITSNNNSSNNNNINNNSSISGSACNISYSHAPNNYRSSSSSNIPIAEAATIPAAGTVEHCMEGRPGNGDLMEELSEQQQAPAESHDNFESLPAAASGTDECSSSAEQLDAAGTLSNEDSSAGRSGKDKTPMCLVNELARYNKITHQYRLTGERGPAHCKTFTVTLKLGEEEYSADGFKIKKAQHLAAAKAIEETKYKHPPPKVRRSDENSSARTHITPTVELNALAMKLGQRTYYLLDPTQLPPADPMLPPDYAPPLLPTPAPGLPPPPPPPPYALRRTGNGGYVLPPPAMHPHHVALQTHRAIYGPQRPFAPKYQSRYTLPPPLGPHMLPGPHGPYAPALPVTPSKITLFVGKQKFVGIGRTLQQAKHDAAARALQVLKAQSNNAGDEAMDDSMNEGDKKSPISQVHEIGIKRNMTVHFKVLREEGPAHMKNFVTACIVGSIVTEGEGNGKKISKKRAAEKMLTELRKLPPLTPTKQTPMKRIKVKTPGKNGGAAAAVSGTTVGAVTPQGKSERRKRLSAVMQKEKATDLDDAENPITKLIQLMQTRKEKEPIFELIAKNGNESSRRREFVMEVSASGSTARGTGNSKKLAKRSAAQALLELLENAAPSGSEVECAVQHNVPSMPPAAGSTTVLEPSTMLDVPMVSTPAGPVPGILILRQNKKPAKKKDAVVVAKSNVELTKERETKPEAAAAANCNSSLNNTNSNNNNNSNNIEVREASSESSLNTSTGSNTSGVSSNSSNVAGAGNSTGSAAGSDGNSNSSGGNSGAGSSRGGRSGGVHMKEQLIYLSKLLDFEVDFSDYPKGNHTEFLTVVTLSTTPPQICHGLGTSCEESQNAAARNALKILSELGLNNAKK